MGTDRKDNFERLVGKKIKGFKFKSDTDGIWYNPVMDVYIGVEGEIVAIRKDYGENIKVDIRHSFKLEARDIWTYPLSEVLKQIELSQDASNYDVY